MPTLTTSGATTAAGVSLILIPVVGLLLMAIPYGYLIYPLPLAVVVPAMFLSKWGFFAAVIPAVLFWAWSLQLFRGEAKLPLRSVALFWVLVGLTLLYFAVSWNYGVVWQGYTHILVVAALNLLSLYVLWRLLGDARARPSFRHNLLFHWALFAWLAWLAFPFLGESP
jgi:hypothetical protein